MATKVIAKKVEIKHKTSFKEEKKVTREEIVKRSLDSQIKFHEGAVKFLSEPWVYTALVSDEWRDLVRQYNEFDYDDPRYSSIGLGDADIKSIWEQCGKPYEEEWGEEEAINLFIPDLCHLFNLTVDEDVHCWDSEGLTIDMR